jgi:hypothetical protein
MLWLVSQVAGEPAAAPELHASARTGLLRVVVGLTAVLALAVIAAHPLVRKVERKLGLTVLVSSGLPFLALGVIFRHPSIGILTDDVVADEMVGPVLFKSALVRSGEAGRRAASAAPH